MTERTCKCCGELIEGRLARAVYCSYRCKKKARRDRKRLSPLPIKQCSVHDCTSSTDGFHRFCPKHWSRMRRTGTTELVQKDKVHGGVALRAYSQFIKGGYAYEYGFHWHPTANPKGIVIQHRRVYYESVDGELYPCYWCGKDLGSWSNTNVDHIDEDKLNNDPANLVASCKACNTQRSQAIGMLKRCRPEVRVELRGMLDAAVDSVTMSV